MDIKKSWLFSRPIAHRGLHGIDAPENSLAAFGKAIEAGFPIEIDVRPIDDGTVVVFHDDKLTRMTDLDGEVLEFVDGRTPLLIEIKNDSTVGQLERDTLELLSSYKGEYAVQSFNPYSMEFFKKNAPQIPRGQLSCFFDKKDLGFFKRFVLKRLKMNKVSSPDFISYNHANLPNKYVTKTKLPTLAWTVRSNAEMEKCLPYCDNIIFENFIPVIGEKEE